MAIAGLVSGGVADLQPTPIAALPARLLNQSVAGREHRRSDRSGEIDPLVQATVAEDRGHARAEARGHDRAGDGRGPQEHRSGAGCVVGEPPLLALLAGEAIEARLARAGGEIGVDEFWPT